MAGVRWTLSETAPLLDGAGGFAEAVERLLGKPAEDARVVVAIAHDVVERREAMRLTRFLHLGELAGVELVVAYGAPVVLGGIEREAGRERPVHADDQGVLAGAAAPRLEFAVHEFLHLLQAPRLVGHLQAVFLLLDDPVNQRLDL